MSTIKATHRSIASLKLPRSNPQLITYAQGIVTSMTGNPSFPSPSPGLASITTATNALQTAETAALTRVKGAAATRNGKRTALAALLELLRAYVQSVSDQTPEEGAALIQSAGLAVRKAAIHAQRVFDARQGAVSGSVKLVAPSAGPRSAYEWESSTDGGKTWVAALPTIQAKTSVTGFTPGSTVQFRYRAVTKTGAGDWSQAVQFIVK